MDQTAHKASPEGEIAAEERKDSRATNTATGSPTAEPDSFCEALARARFVKDLKKVPYPAGVSGPLPCLNDVAPPGKYRYNREFLLQFQHVCVDKPNIVLPLAHYGLEPSELLNNAAGGHKRGTRGQRLLKPNEAIGKSEHQHSTAGPIQADLALSKSGAKARARARRKRKGAGDPLALDEANTTAPISRGEQPGQLEASKQ